MPAVSARARIGAIPNDGRPRMHLSFHPCVALLIVCLLSGCRDNAAAPSADAEPGPAAASTATRDAATIRVATYNTSLYSDRDGGLIARLERDDDKARRIAAVIQRVRPDVLLLNEFDYDAAGRAADLFRHRYLEIGQRDQQPIRYDHVYFAPVNTGVPSGLDLDGDGRTGGAEDAWGFGQHRGQYGMLVLSRYPIDRDAVRTFRKLPWKAMPDARRPRDPRTRNWWYPDPVWERLRLSSKSHWDVPIHTPLGALHFLVAHPTPPVFDGADDHNGARNFDEIRFWAEYISPPPTPAREWIVDDAGVRGRLGQDAAFVIAGDLNADPVDGDGVKGAVEQLLQHPRVDAARAPTSIGARMSSDITGGHNKKQRGNPSADTGAFGPVTGNLRLDYVLPSRTLTTIDRGVFWPAPGEPEAHWIGASDHHLVWLDLQR